MKNIHYLATFLILIAVSFAIATHAQKSDELLQINVCYGTAQLNGTSGVMLDSGCSQGVKHVSLTRKGIPGDVYISDGSLSYAVIFEDNIAVYSTDEKDFGEIDFRIER